MDPFGNDKIARLLRLKRYEQPPPGYFENFLHEFRRRQRDELLRQQPWRIWFERAQGLAVQCKRGFLAPYAAAVAAVLMCGAVFSIRINQRGDTAHFAVQSSRVPTKSPNSEKELDFPAPVLIPPFGTRPGVLLPNARNIRMLRLQPAELLRSDELVPFKLERQSLDDQPLHEE